jgi:hypothetical protein
MMVLPFVGLSGSIIAVLAGRRGLALVLWGVSLAGTLALLGAHATSTLQLAF